MKVKAMAVLLVSVMSMLLVTTVVVEAKSFVVGVLVEDNKVSSIKTNMERDIDNSDLAVKVIRQRRSKTEIIYTGRLGEYENGKWRDINFNGVQFVALFD